MTAGALSGRLTRPGPASAVEHAALHRLRHGVATYQFGPGVTPPPPCGTTRMPRAWSRGDGNEVQARQARHEEPCGLPGAGMRATLLSRQPWRGQEFMGGCASLWMNCASTQDGDAVPRDVPGAALSVRRPITSANAGG